MICYNVARGHVHVALDVAFDIFILPNSHRYVAYMHISKQIIVASITKGGAPK